MIRILNKMISSGTINQGKDKELLNEANEELKELVKNLERDNHIIKDIKVSYFTKELYETSHGFVGDRFRYNQVWAQYIVLYD